MDFVVVGHPIGDSGYGGSRIGERINANVVALVGDGLHREASRGGKLDSEIAFSVRGRSSASFRISTSSAFVRVGAPARGHVPRAAARSAADTTSSSARTASWPLSVISRLHRNTRLGESPVAGNVADGQARLHRLGDDSQLLLGGEAPPTGDAGDDLHAGERVGHRHNTRSVPGPPGYRRCPVETGCSSGTRLGRTPLTLGTDRLDAFARLRAAYATIWVALV